MFGFSFSFFFIVWWMGLSVDFFYRYNGVRLSCVIVSSLFVHSCGNQFVTGLSIKIFFSSSSLPPKSEAHSWADTCLRPLSFCACAFSLVLSVDVCLFDRMLPSSYFVFYSSWLSSCNENFVTSLERQNRTFCKAWLSSTSQPAAPGSCPSKRATHWPCTPRSRLIGGAGPSRAARDSFRTNTSSSRSSTFPLPFMFIKACRVTLWTESFLNQHHIFIWLVLNQQHVLIFHILNQKHILILHILNKTHFDFTCFVLTCCDLTCFDSTRFWSDTCQINNTFWFDTFWSDTFQIKNTFWFLWIWFNVFEFDMFWFDVFWFNMFWLDAFWFNTCRFDTCWFYNSNLIYLIFRNSGTRTRSATSRAAPCPSTSPSTASPWTWSVAGPAPATLVGPSPPPPGSPPPAPSSFPPPRLPTQLPLLVLRLLPPRLPVFTTTIIITTTSNNMDTCPSPSRRLPTSPRRCVLLFLSKNNF